MALEDKLKRLEEECKQREAERVSLELELTEVKESLKKALAGGVTLGLAIEPRSGTSSPQVSVLKAQPMEVPHGLSGSFLTTMGGARLTFPPCPVCGDIDFFVHQSVERLRTWLSSAWLVLT